MKIFKVFLIIFLIGYSCKNSKNANDSIKIIFNIEELPKVTNLKLTDLGIFDIEYVPLETKNSNVFSCASNSIIRGKLVFGHNFYIIQCLHDILMFKDNGFFDKKIGTRGRGPNEYLVAHDVQVDEKNQEIYILAGWQQKFFVYSTNGDLIRTFQIPFFCSEFVFVENGILCYSENHMGNIEKSYNLIDTNGNIIKSFSNKYPFQNHDAYGILGENLFYHFNTQVFNKEVYSDTVYLYKNGEFYPHLVINVGDKLITPDARSKFEGKYLADKYISPLKLFEFGNYVYYEFIYRVSNPRTLYCFIGSKNDDFQVVFNRDQGIINDIDGGPSILPMVIKDDRTMIAQVDALQFKQHVASEEFKNFVPKFPEKKKELEKLANSMKETDNPVLMIIRLKK
jgi:hypothetical protein